MTLDKDKLIEAIEASPRIDQLVLSLRYDDGLSFEEIAEVLELTYGQVRRIHFYAYTRITESAKTHPGDTDD